MESFDSCLLLKKGSGSGFSYFLQIYFIKAISKYELIFSYLIQLWMWIYEGVQRSKSQKNGGK